MKNLLMIIVIVAVLGGGGLFALIQLGIVPDPFADPSMAETELGEDGEPIPPPKELLERQQALVPLEDIVVPVIIDGQVVRNVTLQMRVHVQWEGRGQMRDDAPRMRGIVIQTMLAFLPDNYSNRTRLQVRQMKRALDRALKRAYGDRVYEAVLINVFEQ